MSVLNNADLATAISDSDCGNCETVNAGVLAGLGIGSAIFVVPVGDGGDGVNGATEDDIEETLEQITARNAALVNGLITTGYEIVSQNGFPN